MKKLLILATLSCAVLASATTTMYFRRGAGGTLTAPTAVGQKIWISTVALEGGGTAIMSCPITFFGAGTYQWNWKCSGGHIAVNNVIVATTTGTMTLTCSGGGRLSRITCWHTFKGTATGINGGSGPIIVLARGGPNNAPGKITAWAATW